MIYRNIIELILQSKYKVLIIYIFIYFFVYRYLTVMFSTGPMFLTHEASYYVNRSSLNILSSELYGKYSYNSSYSLFQHLKGGIINL
jgi:hypothetical protein